MDNAQDEMNAALDALEADHGIPQEEEPTENIGAVQEEEAPQEEAPQEDKPKGYITYEDWVESGKDPADFKGENAYKAEYERLQDIREMKDTMKAMVSGMDDWKQQQEDKTVREIAAERDRLNNELKKAKDDYDMDGALDAQEKLRSLDDQPAAQQPQVNPAITNFVSKNPIIDNSNAQYDSEFASDVQMLHNTTINKLTGGDLNMMGQLTEGQIQRSLNVAMAQAKELHPDKFKSPRNNRQRTQSQKQKPQSNNVDMSAKLKGFAKNSRNPQDVSPANDLYELIKAKDPKAAESFAKRVLGE